LLDQAIGNALNIVAAGTRPRALHLHPEQGRPWIIVIRPLLSSYGPFGQIRCDLLVEIHDVIPRIGSIDLLQPLYELSSREMQLVRLLVDGHSLQSAARVMAITENTVRTHLRAVFEKTATTRQSELIRLCAGLSER
jgi:DNA-binding CsgD family transcriptional regulator